MSDKREKRARMPASPGHEDGPGAAIGSRRLPNGRDEDWLERKIRDMYQDVVNEPVPEEILNVLNRIPKPDD